MSERARWAADPARSRGRRFNEPPPGQRSEFQRDRDRIVHCTAFRRLEYKTQVFLNHESDLFRTRLTHSIEVAQIARTIARALGLDEDLTEAISLAHDLGHTPFGHAGQDALDRCMRPWGGFEHNLQSLRVVDLLEERYAAFDGLNLCFETREGILKHCSPAVARTLGDVGERFLARHQPSVEAQVANLADEIAYNNHDIDDGIRARLLEPQALQGLELFARHSRGVSARHPGLPPNRQLPETIRAMINELVGDLLEQTRGRIGQLAPRDVDDVRRAGPVVAFSDRVRGELNALQGFLRRALYRHERVMAVMAQARQVIERLFERYRERPDLLPVQHQARADQWGERAIADYVAGMTDRYALAQYVRLIDPAADIRALRAAGWPTAGGTQVGP